MKKNFLYFIAGLLLFSMVNLQCSSSRRALSPGSPLISFLSRQPNLSTLTSLLQTPGLGDMLGPVLQRPFTLLAPDNEAFHDMGDAAVANLAAPSNLSSLAALLKNHFIPGKKEPSIIADGGIATAADRPLSLGNTKMGPLMTTDQFYVIPVDKVQQ